MIGLGNLLGDEGPSEPRCSRAGCDASATTTVNWRNPKIHTVDRVKVWLACDEHSGYLSEFLAARNFPVLTAPLAEVVAVVPDLARTGLAPTGPGQAGVAGSSGSSVTPA